MSLKQKQEERLKLLEEFKRKKEMLKNNLERRGAKATRPTALKSNTTAIAFKSTPVGKSSAKNAEKLCSNPLATEIKQERELIVKTELNPERSLANSCHNQYVDLHNDDITSENIQTFSECLVSPTVQSTAAAASSKATTEKENFFDVTYESERGVDGCETELIRAQQVYDMRNNLEDIQSPEDSERSNQSISFPFLKTTIQSAVNASRIDLNLARDIFYQLKKVDFPTKAMYNDGMEIKVLDRPWRFNIQFWLEWARIEEANGAVVECEEVFAEAADALSGVEALSVLRLEYNLFQARLGQAYQLKVIPDEEDEDAQLISVTPMETYLQDSSIPTDEDKDFIPYIKPELESISDTVDKSTMSLVNMLSDLKLKELSPVKVKVKLEDEQHIYYFPRQQSAKKIMKSRVGVPIHVQGSSVTVLTPIKASKKLQNGTLSLNLELGVECVITPVRRSLRFHDDDDYTSSAAKPESVQDIGGKELRNPTKDEKVRQLLEEHEFAYVPNKNVQVANIFGKQTHE